MTLSVSTIEDALITTLQADGILSAGCKTIDHYEGQILEDLQTPFYQSPALLVLYHGATYTPVAVQRFQYVDWRFTVLCIVVTLEGNQSARHGETQRLGTYDLLQQARSVLQGSLLGLTDFMPVQILSEEALVNTKAVSIYQLDLISRHNRLAFDVACP